MCQPTPHSLCYMTNKHMKKFSTGKETSKLSLCLPICVPQSFANCWFHPPSCINHYWQSLPFIKSVWLVCAKCIVIYIRTSEGRKKEHQLHCREISVIVNSSISLSHLRNGVTSRTPITQGQTHFRCSFWEIHFNRLIAQLQYISN